MAYTPGGFFEPREREEGVYWDCFPPDENSHVVVVRRPGNVVWEVYVPPQSFLTQAQAAALLGVSLTTINAWARQGQIHQVKAFRSPSLIPVSEALRVWRLLTPGYQF